MAIQLVRSINERVVLVDAEVRRVQLLGQLRKTKDLASYVATLDSAPPTLAQCLTRLLEKKGLKRSKVVAAANINCTFGYQIFVGQRRASRNKLLALCVAMGTDLDEADCVLRSGGVNGLYEADRRDAIIMYGLMRGRTLQQVEEDLYAFGLPPLGSFAP